MQIGLCSAQAPGDENQSCTNAHTYPESIKILMDSWNYEQLLPGHSGQPIAGAVWTDASCDNNDATPFSFLIPPFVSVYIHVYIL